MDENTNISVGSAYSLYKLDEIGPMGCIVPVKIPFFKSSFFVGWSLTLGEEHGLRVFENSVEDIWT
jgi:hypothetical protein